MSFSYVYLASQSPRRRELLTQLGVSYKLLLADASEDVERLEHRIGQESPRHYVQRVTTLKAGAALIRRQQGGLARAPILVADTTVAMGSKIFGKPESTEQARQFLAQLSGRSHWVFTAVAVTLDRRLELMLCESRVTMSRMTPAQIRRYVASGESEGKAGAYAIQGRAAAFVTHISGSHSAIVGLPLAETAQLLRSFAVSF
jgi:septum formation protein